MTSHKKSAFNLSGTPDPQLSLPPPRHPVLLAVVLHAEGNGPRVWIKTQVVGRNRLPVDLDEHGTLLLSVQDDLERAFLRTVFFQEQLGMQDTVIAKPVDFHDFIV